MAGILSPTANPFVQNTLEGLRKELARPAYEKSPFTVKMLKAIVEDTRRNYNLPNVHLAAACMLAFSGFLRFDELANIRVCDVSIGPQYLTIRIPLKQNQPALPRSRCSHSNIWS